MFSGIVAAIGHIVETAPLGNGLRLAVDVGDWDVSDVAIGDSVAHNGVCLTVVAQEGSKLYYDVSAEMPS